MPEKISTIEEDKKEVASEGAAKNKWENIPFFEETAGLEAPMLSIFSQLYPEIRKGIFGIIIGDDISGRIPTLIMDKVIKKIYEAHHYDMPIVRFVAGSGSGLAEVPYGTHKQKEIKIHEYLSRLEGVDAIKSSGKKVLIVTDTIRTGESIRPITRVLQELGIGFTIVTIGLVKGNDSIENTKNALENDLGGKIIYGQRGQPSLYNSGEKKYMAGVQKNPTELHSTGVLERTGLKRESRKDASIIARRLLTQASSIESFYRNNLGRNFDEE